MNARITRSLSRLASAGMSSALFTLFFQLAVLALILGLSTQTVLAAQYQIIFTSDQHYGITRKAFRGQRDVSAKDVNAAMTEAIKALPAMTFPADGGVRAGEPVAWADFIISSGDIANRMEGTSGVLTAAECWSQFAEQYLAAPLVLRRDGAPAEVLVSPGNHDVSNAVGFYRPMSPPKDKSSLLAIYNRAIGTNKSPAEFDEKKDRMFLRRDLDGARLLVVQMWPDKTAREWLETQIEPGTATLLFTHDQPDLMTKHLVNPNGNGDINATDKFENVVFEVASVKTIEESTIQEQRELAAFLKRRPVAAYFHGHTNYNEFYTWKGPDNDISLPVFRVDSPMKGKYSKKHEEVLSFQLVSIDTDAHVMTVREVLWNTGAGHPVWGAGITIPLAQ